MISSHLLTNPLHDVLGQNGVGLPRLEMHRPDAFNVTSRWFPIEPGEANSFRARVVAWLITVLLRFIIQSFKNQVSIGSERWGNDLNELSTSGGLNVDDLRQVGQFIVIMRKADLMGSERKLLKSRKKDSAFHLLCVWF